MVSSSDLAIGGLVLVLLGVSITSLFRIRGPSDLPQDTMEDPNQIQIQGLTDLLKEARNIFAATFKKPPPLGCGGIGQIACRGPLAAPFGAAGVVSSIDPFTGMRIVVGFTGRASGKTQAFIGDISANLARVQAGTTIKTQFNEFISNLRNEIKILQTPNTVTV